VHSAISSVAKPKNKKAASQTAAHAWRNGLNGSFARCAPVIGRWSIIGEQIGMPAFVTGGNRLRST